MHDTDPLTKQWESRRTLQISCFIIHNKLSEDLVLPPLNLHLLASVMTTGSQLLVLSKWWRVLLNLINPSSPPPSSSSIWFIFIMRWFRATWFAYTTYLNAILGIWQEAPIFALLTSKWGGLVKQAAPKYVHQIRLMRNDAGISEDRRVMENTIKRNGVAWLLLMRERTPTVTWNCQHAASTCQSVHLIATFCDSSR